MADIVPVAPTRINPTDEAIRDLIRRLFGEDAPVTGVSEYMLGPQMTRPVGLPSLADFDQGGMGLGAGGNPIDPMALPQNGGLPSLTMPSPLESAAEKVGVPSPRKETSGPSMASPQGPSAGVAPMAPQGQDMAPYMQLLKDQLNRPAPSVEPFMGARQKAPTFDEVMQSGENMGPLLLAFAQGLAQPNTPFVTSFANALGGVGKTVQGIRGEKAKEIADTRKEQLEEFQQAVSRARMQQDQQRNQASIASDIVRAAQGQDKTAIDRFQADTVARRYADEASMTPARINALNAQAEAARSLAAQRNEGPGEDKLPAADRIVLQGVVSRWQAMQKRLDEDTSMSPGDRLKAEMRLKEQLKGILKATGKEHLMPQLDLYAAVPKIDAPPLPGK